MSTDEWQQQSADVARAQIERALRDAEDNRLAQEMEYRAEQQQLVEDANYLGMKARLLFKYRSPEEAEAAFYEREADATMFQHWGT